MKMYWIGIVLVLCNGPADLAGGRSVKSSKSGWF